jgi:Fe-S-cluster containining protein
VKRTCPGHCCVAFYLETPHDRLDELRDEMRDGEQIAEMVIPLTVAEANRRLERFGAGREYEPDAEGHVYACRNLDEATLLCKIYHERPEMCRDYPGSCDAGCEYECGYESTADIIGKWQLFNAEPRRMCPPREPMSQR